MRVIVLVFAIGILGGAAVPSWSSDLSAKAPTCRVIEPEVAAKAALAPRLQSASLPAGARTWETIPCVIRANGTDTCRVEIFTNGPVKKVFMTSQTFYIAHPTPDTVFFHDDGVSPDRVAGDYVYSAGPFRYDMSQTFPAYFDGDGSSPAGLFESPVGNLVIQEMDDSQTGFIQMVQMGLLSPSVPAVTASHPASDVQTTKHLINVQTSDRQIERILRSLPADIPSVTLRFYTYLSDAFDFLAFFSTDRIEVFPYAADNWTKGSFLAAQVNFTGTGVTPFAQQSQYGSATRLLGMAFLSPFDEGITGSNITHELTHEWAAHTHTAVGGGHYPDNSSVGSLVGGFLWTNNGNGTYTPNCNEGRNGATHAPPLDLYMMGLINASAVPDAYLSNGQLCGQPVTIANTVTIQDIQTADGQRNPKPNKSQKSFNIGFVAESNNRLLNATELTFFDSLASHYTKVLPPSTPDPYMGQARWPPVTRYFAHGTTWTSTVPTPMGGGAAAALSPEPDLERATPLALEVSPNPSNGSILVRWRAEGVSRSQSIVEVFDLAGRKVRTLTAVQTPGAFSSFWDGRDESGVRMRRGLYLVRVSTGNVSATRRFTLLR